MLVLSPFISWSLFWFFSPLVKDLKGLLCTGGRPGPQHTLLTAPSHCLALSLPCVAVSLPFSGWVVQCFVLRIRAAPWHGASARQIWTPGLCSTELAEPDESTLWWLCHFLQHLVEFLGAPSHRIAWRHGCLSMAAVAELIPGDVYSALGMCQSFCSPW